MSCFKPISVFLLLQRVYFTDYIEGQKRSIYLYVSREILSWQFFFIMGNWEDPFFRTGVGQTIFIRLQIISTHNVMAQSSLVSSSSSGDTLFPCSNLSCGWPIVLTFLCDFSYHWRKVHFQFGLCGPYCFRKRGPKGVKIGVWLKPMENVFFFFSDFDYSFFVCFLFLV